MAKEFVCKLDGMSFQTKEEMESHIIETYLKVVKKEDEVNEIQSKLEKELDDFIVQVSNDPSLLDHSRLEFQEDGFDDAIYVELSLKDGDWDFYFAISPHQYSEFNDELRVYKTLEEAINELHVLMNGLAYLTSSLSSKYTFLREVEKRPNIPFSVAFDQIEQERIDGEHAFYVYLKKYFSSSTLNVEAEVLLFDWSVLESNESFQQAINKQLRRVEGPYLSFTEGDIEIEASYDTRERDDTYFINGIDVEDMAKRAKRMRLTILE